MKKKLHTIFKKLVKRTSTFVYICMHIYMYYINMLSTVVILNKKFNVQTIKITAANYELIINEMMYNTDA